MIKLSKIIMANVLGIVSVLGLSLNVQAQVTNVNQLRDVSPGDWAYEALRSLVERYDCIVGYPNQIYRGTRALSRYEFVAGLNACLNQIERLNASSEVIVREDLNTLRRLIQEFELELASVDSAALLKGLQIATDDRLNSITLIGEPRKVEGVFITPDLNLNTQTIPESSPGNGLMLLGGLGASLSVLKQRKSQRGSSRN